MKKILITFLTLIFVVSTNIQVFAATSIDQSRSIIDDNVRKIIDNYIQYRQDSFNIAENKIATSPKESILKNRTKNNLIFSDEQTRASKLQKLEKKLNIKLNTAKTTAEIKDITYDGNSAVVTVYEWTFVDYTGEKGLVDTFGYGVDHILNLTIDKNNVTLVSDIYNEGPLTEMSSSSYIATNIDTNTNKTPITDTKVAAVNPLNTAPANLTPKITSANGVISPMQVVGFSFSRSAVAAYANQWVKHTDVRGIYASYYNPAYKNYNPNGGDCANYVSQCIVQSLPQIGKNKLSNTFPAWWYNNKGTSSTSDDSVSTDWTWTSADANKKGMAANFGPEKINPANSDIQIGDPIYANWDGEGSKWDHAFICVGMNKDGKPIINSHNNDYYHVYWKYGDSSTKYTVIQIPDIVYIDASKL